MTLKDKFNDMMGKAKDMTSSIDKSKLQNMANKAKDLAGAVNKESIQDAVNKAKDADSSINMDNIQDAVNKAKEMASSINKDTINETADKLRNLAGSPDQLKKFATKKYIGIACGILAVIFIGYFLFGGDSNEVKMVKNTPVPFAINLTLGKIVDNYQYIKDPEWKIIEKSNGQKAVQCKALCNNIIPAMSVTLGGNSGLKKELVEAIAKFLTKEDYHVYMVIQFLLDSYDQNINGLHVGSEYDGNTSDFAGQLLGSETVLNLMFKNEPVRLLYYPSMGEQKLSYLFYKYIVSHLTNDVREVIAELKVMGGREEDLVKLSNIHKPLVIYNLSKPEFDDGNNDIYFDVKEEITNIPSQVAVFETVNLASSPYSKAKYKVLQQNTYYAGLREDKGEVQQMGSRTIQFSDNPDTFVFGVQMHNEYPPKVDVKTINFYGEIKPGLLTSPDFAK